MPIQLAGCVLLDDSGRILLLHRNKNGTTQWELPGGKVDLGEDKAAAAIREMSEELGIDVNIEKRIDSINFSTAGKDYAYTWFLATIPNGEPLICEPETFDDLSYFDFDQLQKIELSGNMQEFVKYLRLNNLSLKDLTLR